MPDSNFRVRGNIDVKGKDLTPATCRASLSGSTSVPAPPSYPPKAEWDFPHQMRATLRITTAIHLDTQSVLPNPGDMQNMILLKNPLTICFFFLAGVRQNTLRVQMNCCRDP